MMIKLGQQRARIVTITVPAEKPKDERNEELMESQWIFST